MTSVPTLDSLDARIMLALDEDPEATVLALARTLGVARNTVHARLQRITRAGLLTAPSRRLDPQALGYGLVAFVEMSISQGAADLAITGLLAIPEIIEIHSTTGDADLLAKVLARDTADLYRVTNAILGTRGVLRTSTAISLLEVLPHRLTKLLEQAARPTAQPTAQSAAQSAPQSAARSAAT
jgi:DNA-binding Lrp family transcriptional regulator